MEVAEDRAPLVTPCRSLLTTKPRLHCSWLLSTFWSPPPILTSGRRLEEDKPLSAVSQTRRETMTMAAIDMNRINFVINFDKTIPYR